MIGGAKTNRISARSPECWPSPICECERAAVDATSGRRDESWLNQRLRCLFRRPGAISPIQTAKAASRASGMRSPSLWRSGSTRNKSGHSRLHHFVEPDARRDAIPHFLQGVVGKKGNLEILPDMTG